MWMKGKASVLSQVDGSPPARIAAHRAPPSPRFAASRDHFTAVRRARRRVPLWGHSSMPASPANRDLRFAKHPAPACFRRRHRCAGRAAGACGRMQGGAGVARYQVLSRLTENRPRSRASRAGEGSSSPRALEQGEKSHETRNVPDVRNVSGSAGRTRSCRDRPVGGCRGRAAGNPGRQGVRDRPGHRQAGGRAPIRRHHHPGPETQRRPRHRPLQRRPPDRSISPAACWRSWPWWTGQSIATSTRFSPATWRPCTP